MNGFKLAAVPPVTKGKKLLLFGDSITATQTALGAAMDNWPVYAAPILESSYSNYALSGASFTDWAYESPRQQLSVQINDAIAAGEKPDIVVISIGTNDYSRLSLFGDYDTAIGKTTLELLDKTLVLEAARWAFWKIKTQWPHTVCYYALPLQRASTQNGTEADDNGKWLRDGLRRMANRYNFIVIDAYSESGIVKDFEVNGAAGRYLSDGLHPNPTGQELMGRFYAREIIRKYR